MTLTTNLGSTVPTRQLPMRELLLHLLHRPICNVAQRMRNLHAELALP